MTPVGILSFLGSSSISSPLQPSCCITSYIFLAASHPLQPSCCITLQLFSFVMKTSRVKTLTISLSTSNRTLPHAPSPSTLPALLRSSLVCVYIMSELILNCYPISLTSGIVWKASTRYYNPISLIGVILWTASTRYYLFLFPISKYFGGVQEDTI